MSFAGRVKIWQVRCADLAVEDSVSDSSDPYFVIKYPGGGTFKSEHFDEELNPTWTNLNVEWPFSNWSMPQEFRFEVWDHDRIGSDDEIGFATFMLQDLATRHSPVSNLLELPLRTSKGVATGRGTAFLSIFVVCPDLVNADLYSNDVAAITRGCNNMKGALDEYWDNNDRYQRVLQLSTVPGPCSEAAIGAFLHYLFDAISPQGFAKIPPARQQQVLAALETLWKSPVSQKPLVLCLADHSHLLASPVLPTVVKLVTEALPALLSAMTANATSVDAALASALLSLARTALGCVESIVNSHQAIIPALETYCLTIPFAKDGLSLDAALLLGAVYKTGGLAVAGTDAAKLNRLFSVWLTDPNVNDQSALPLLEVYKHLKTLGAPFDEASLFQSKQLPPRAFAYYYHIGAIPLTPVAQAELPLLNPQQLRLIAETQSFFPQTALVPNNSSVDEDWGYTFQGQHVTFVQQVVSQKPFTIFGAALLNPRATPWPTPIVQIFACDQVPTSIDLASFDNCDSAALFFSLPHAAYLHPAMFIDARKEGFAVRFASAISSYLQPTRYVIIRLRGAASSPDGEVPTQTMHQIQTISVIGYTGSDVFPLSGPQLTSSIESAIHSLKGDIYAQVLVEPEAYPPQTLPGLPPNVTNVTADTWPIVYPDTNSRGLDVYNTCVYPPGHPYYRRPPVTGLHSFFESIFFSFGSGGGHRSHYRSHWVGHHSPFPGEHHIFSSHHTSAFGHHGISHGFGHS